jgi:hypothetical protein
MLFRFQSSVMVAINVFLTNSLAICLDFPIRVAIV